MSKGTKSAPATRSGSRLPRRRDAQTSGVPSQTTRCASNRMRRNSISWPGLCQEIHVGSHDVVGAPRSNHLCNSLDRFNFGDRIKGDAQNGYGEPGRINPLSFQVYHNTILVTSAVSMQPVSSRQQRNRAVGAPSATAAASPWPGSR